MPVLVSGGFADMFEFRFRGVLEKYIPASRTPKNVKLDH